VKTTTLILNMILLDSSRVSTRNRLRQHNTEDQQRANRELTVNCYNQVLSGAFEPYCFKPASQFDAKVNGSFLPFKFPLFTKNFLPSALTSNGPKSR
jgi:hypothetical protein